MIALYVVVGLGLGHPRRVIHLAGGSTAPILHPAFTTRSCGRGDTRQVRTAESGGVITAGRLTSADVRDNPRAPAAGDAYPAAGRPGRFGDGWLDLLAGMLARAAHPGVPLLERARFLATYSFRLDEFFTVGTALSPDPPARAGIGKSCADTLMLRSLNAEHDRLLGDEVLPALAAEGIVFPSWSEMGAPEQGQLRAMFRVDVYPLVTPLVVDAAHPFPRIAALLLNLGVLVRDPLSRVERFVCVQVPSRLPDFVRLDETRVLRTAALLSALLPEVFPGMEVLERSNFRVTRIHEVQGGVDGAARAVSRRADGRRPGPPVRLEVESTMSTRMLGILQGQLRVANDRVFRVRTPLGLAGTIWAITHDVALPPVPGGLDRLSRCITPARWLIPTPAS